MRIGIRREDKHRWERRVPLTPDAVAQLTAAGLSVQVQPSTIRVFDDEEYRQAGAIVEEDLAACDLLFAVKEIPVELLRPKKSYVFFSHTIKGQAHNMSLLQRVLDLGCTLFDYERIVDAAGRRLVFFGHHAGVAGMIDSLAVLGRRLASRGETTALAELELAHGYDSVEAALAHVREVGGGISRDLRFGIAGDGNVSRGAQKVVAALGAREVSPNDLASSTGVVYCVYREADLVRPLEGEFSLQEYYDHPERYRSQFERHLPHIDVLINAIYWTEKYPRLLSLQQLKRPELIPRLLLIGDISCDINGAIECTVKATTPGQPAYCYAPDSGAVEDGWEGEGIAMMTTDCLPCEVPREASESFTSALLPFVAPLAEALQDPDMALAQLPPELARATIALRGQLCPDYAYLRPFLQPRSEDGAVEA